MKSVQSNKSSPVNRDVEEAVRKIQNTLDERNDNFCSVFRDLECSETKEQVIAGLKKLNALMRHFRRIVPQQEHFKVIRKTIQELGVSEKFEANLQREYTLDGTDKL